MKSIYKSQIDNRLAKMGEGDIGTVQVRWQYQGRASKYIEDNGYEDITHDKVFESGWAYQKWASNKYCTLYFKK